MPSTDRILIVGIDYSDFCIPALDQALLIAAQSAGTRLVPLLALPQNAAPKTSLTEPATREFVERARENLSRLVQERASALGVKMPPIAPEVCFGKPATRLIERAGELEAALIVLGTHGHQGLQELLMGSVTEEVVRKASCSVLVARKQAASVGAPTHVPAADALLGRATSARDFSPAEADLDAGTEGPAGPNPAASDGTGAELLTGPHIDAGRVVLHVLDVPSGQTFVCSFRDFGSVRVEPLEGQWVPQPSSEERARAARLALEEARRDPAQFEELFEEIARRNRTRGPELE
jgi:nucleotide-binding universal stress UspA family protein